MIKHKDTRAPERFKGAENREVTRKQEEADEQQSQWRSKTKQSSSQNRHKDNSKKNMETNTNPIITAIASHAYCVRHKNMSTQIIPYNNDSPKITIEQTKDMAYVLDTWKFLPLFNCQNTTTNECKPTFAGGTNTGQVEKTTKQ